MVKDLAEVFHLINPLVDHRHEKSILSIRIDKVIANGDALN